MKSSESRGVVQVFRKFLTAVLAAALIPAAACMAADVDIKQNQTDASVRVSGELGKDNSRRMLMLYCMKGDSGLGEVPAESDTQQATDAFSAIAYTASDENGTYIFPDIFLNGESGEYSFYVTVFNSDKVYSLSNVKLVTESYINEFIASVSEKSGAEVYEKTEGVISEGLLELNIPLYGKLTEEGKKKAAAKLNNTAITSVADFSEKMNRACAAVGLDYSKDGAALDLFLFPEKNETELTSVIKELSGADVYKSVSCMKSLEKKDSAARAAILSSALGAQWSNRDELAEKIYISVINYEMKNCGGYGDISAIIELYKDDVLKAFDYGAYQKSSYRSSLNKELLKKQFNSVGEMVEYMEKYLEKAAEDNSGSKGSGGSSKGGTSSPVYVPDKNKPAEDNGKNNESFSDMTDFEWAKEAVSYLSEKGIINGKGNGMFEPHSNVTREEFVKMLVLAFSLSDENAGCSFSDVSSGAWFKPYVASAVKNGVINGISPELFGAGEYITRQDMAVCVFRAAGAQPEAFDDGLFTDSDKIAPYAREGISWMKKNGLISGYSDGSFAPAAFCTRAEAAKIIYEAITRIGR